MNPLQSAISRTRWEYFCTPTYESRDPQGNPLSVPAYYVRRRMLFEWLRKVASSFSCPWEYLLWIAREERGETNGREHWHVLLAGLNYVPGRGIVPSPNQQSDVFRLVNLFAQCGLSAGICDVRPYDVRLSGADYIMKGLDGYDWTPWGANSYEGSKFVEDIEAERSLILAHAWVRHVAMRSRNRRDLRARDLKKVKRDRSTRGVSSSVPSPKRFPHPYAGKEIG
jgi:hypothetical protein